MSKLNQRGEALLGFLNQWFALNFNGNGTSIEASQDQQELEEPSAVVKVLYLSLFFFFFFCTAIEARDSNAICQMCPQPVTLSYYQPDQN